MAMALPFVFALGGGALFGTPGAAAGLLIGAWLFGPKAKQDNQIFDPGAQEMPRFNQSLRGSTMPVLFGTNRVNSNVVWVKNFQTIRTENSQGGGGKGGGSGMGGKTPPGPKTVSYDYKWDMIFHMGMGHQTFGLFKGWNGGQRLTIETVQRIIANTTGIPSVFDSLGSAGADLMSKFPQNPDFVQNSKNALATAASTNNEVTLAFDDAFYGPGDPTGTEGNSWAYFASQEGQPCRWPNTYYVGFKSLDLGSNATVPQLSFEIGPDGGTFTSDPLFLSAVSPDTVGSVQDSAVCVGEDGKHYMWRVAGADQTHQFLWRVEDGTIIELPCSAATLLTGALTQSSRIFILADTPYFYHAVCRIETGNETPVDMLLYKINSSGAAELVSESRIENPIAGLSLALFELSIVGAGLFNDNTLKRDVRNAVPVYVVSDGTTQYLLSLPPVDGEHFLSPPGTWADRMVELDAFGDHWYDADSTRHSGYVRRFFFLSKYGTPDPLGGVQNELWVCSYVGKPEIAATNNANIMTLAATNPDGFVAAVKFTELQLGTKGGLEVITSLFKNKDGTAALPFSDDALDGDGSTANDLASYQNPVVQYADQYQTWILSWAKTFTAQADLTPTGSQLKLVVMSWNAEDPEALVQSTRTGAWFDTVADTGATELNRYSNVPTNIWSYIDFTQGGVVGVGGLFFGDAGIGTRLVGSIFGTIAISIGGDVYPPFIIKEILSNIYYGMGIDSGFIDSASYQTVIDFCTTNNISVSTQYTRDESVLGAIEELLALYGGYLVVTSGKIRFGLVKATDADSPVRTIDNSHLIPPKEGDPPVTVTKAARQDGYNKIRVNYIDRALDYRQNYVEVSDEVDMDFNGVRYKEFQPQFVMRNDLAQQIAERALWTNLYGRDSYAFVVGFKDSDLEPGDVITLVDSFHTELRTGKTVRITRWQERKRGQFSVVAQDEIPVYIDAAHDTLIVSSTSGGKGIHSDIQPNYANRMYELPREFQASAARVWVGYNQSSNIRGAGLYLSADGVSFTAAQQVEPYNISGIFASALPARDPGFVESDVLMYLMPSSPFNPSSPVYVQTLALDDATELVRATGGSVLIAGSEALAIEGLTLLAQNKYRVAKVYRGWGGTRPQDHSSGAYWHRHGTGIFNQEISTDRIGTLVYYKVVPYNFNGEAPDITSIAANTYQIQGSYWRPQGLALLDVFVDTPLSGTNSDALVGPYKAVTSGGCDAHFAWPDADRQSGYGAGGYGSQPYGQSNPDADAHTWRVEVLSTDGSVVRSLSVDSGPWTYDRATNSADFNGFAQQFAVRVTPRNIYGDARFNVTRSLNLFW